VGYSAAECGWFKKGKKGGSKGLGGTDMRRGGVLLLETKLHKNKTATGFAHGGLVTEGKRKKEPGLSKFT